MKKRKNEAAKGWTVDYPCGLRVQQLVGWRESSLGLKGSSPVNMDFRGIHSKAEKPSVAAYRESDRPHPVVWDTGSIPGVVE